MTKKNILRKQKGIPLNYRKRLADMLTDYTDAQLLELINTPSVSHRPKLMAKRELRSRQ